MAPPVAAVSCEDPGLPVHGQRVLSELRFGGIANFSCDDGYKLLGNPSMRCLASGNWLGRVPSCEGMERETEREGERQRERERGCVCVREREKEREREREREGERESV